MIESEAVRFGESLFCPDMPKVETTVADANLNELENELEINLISRDK
jgi:hypothetical protein